MIIETLADIGDKIYFILEGKIAFEVVKSIRIEINSNKEISIYYYSTGIGRKEDVVALTQEGLFKKIKLVENET